MARFEEKYEDVLQNIEFGIIQVYREHPEMMDWDVLNAINALIRVYQAETRGQPTLELTLAPLAEETFDAAHAMCNWRLGRAQLIEEDNQPVELDMSPKTVDEILACLKRIRRSIDHWSKRGGRQGYLSFVNDFFPG